MYHLSFEEFTIRRWINDNRPDLRHCFDKESIESILRQLKEDIEDLDPFMKKVHIHAYLRQCYPIELTEMVKDIVDDLEDEYAETVQDWRNFAVYHSEIGAIIRELCAKGLKKKYITYENDEMVIDDRMREEILRVVKERIEEEWR